MVAGSWRAADAIAEFTSCAAASMSRSSANTMVMRVTPCPLTELISSMPAMVENCFSRSEEHTSELQSPDLVCRLLLEKKKPQEIKTSEVQHNSIYRMTQSA